MDKPKSQLKIFVYAVATISGTIVGVGLFSLPYIASKVGIWLILGYFLALGVLVALVHSFFGELALSTPDLKRLPGFAKIYLGSIGEKVALVSMVLGALGATLAYLIVGGRFLSELLLPILGGNDFIYTLIYFVFGATMIFFGIQAVSKIEFWGLISFFLVLVAMYFRGHSLINIGNLTLEKINVSNFFLPYGPILFSLWGATLIPEAEEMLGKNKNLLLKIILVATIIPIIIYLLFIYLILGITGFQTTESALIGLGNFLGKEIVSLALFFGVLTTFTSFIALGLTMKKVLWYDLKMNKNMAWAITCFGPLILFLIGIKSFISVIGFVGGVMLGINGILILLMYRKLEVKKFRFSVLPLILIFIFGIIYEIAYFFK